MWRTMNCAEIWPSWNIPGSSGIATTTTSSRSTAYSPYHSLKLFFFGVRVTGLFLPREVKLIGGSDFALNSMVPIPLCMSHQLMLDK